MSQIYLSFLFWSNDICLNERSRVTWSVELFVLNTYFTHWSLLFTGKVGNFERARAPWGDHRIQQRRLRPSPERRRERLDSPFVRHKPCSSPGAVGPVETRRGEGPLRLFSWYPPGVSPEAPSDTQVPRRSASAVRVLSSSSHERCPEKISRHTVFFPLVRSAPKERGVCFRLEFFAIFYVDYSRSPSSRTVNHRRFWRGLVYGTLSRLANSANSRAENVCGKSEGTLENSGYR